MVPGERMPGFAGQIAVDREPAPCIVASGLNCRWHMKACFKTIAMALAGLLLAAAAFGEQQIRQAVCATSFYPADARDLRAFIDDLTAKSADACRHKRLPGALRALILPHAGYRYSGSIAACGASLLKGAAFDKVIVMGPDHRVGFHGGEISAADYYATPLGRIRLHADARRLVGNESMFRAGDRSDLVEHSVEAVLPFLQTHLGSFELVPIVLGPASPRETANALLPLLTPRTLLVASADLSHYLPYDQAVAKDKRTLSAIVTGDVETVLGTANGTCGRYPVAVLMTLARQLEWRAVLLNYANSGDTAGDRGAVVGYAAIAFYGEKTMTEATPQFTDRQGRALVSLARKTLMDRFGRKMDDLEAAALQKAIEDPALQVRCGTFVTLKRGGQLRGCIGSLEGRDTLVEGVRGNAVNAAFRDPRFRPLEKRELDTISIEVSVLTQPQPLEYKDGQDLAAKLRPGIDGVIIRKGHASATFLPQVWEQLPDPNEFLSHLCMKAGLSAQAWREGRLSVEIYHVQYFEESR